MKKITEVRNWILLIACAILIIGCGQNRTEGSLDNSIALEDQDARPFEEVTKLKQGLNIITQTEGDELVIGYREADNAVYFQTLRGEELVFGENTIDPDAPQYEISVRVVNTNGDPITVAIGGDNNGRTIDWLEPVTGLYSDYINTERSDELKLATKAADVLSESIVGFDEEILALKQHIDAAIVDSSTIENQTVEEETSRSSKATSTWSYCLRIKKKGVLFNGSPADHSALFVSFIRPDGRAFTYVTCNHGTCADDSSMQISGEKSFVKSNSLPVVDSLPCDNAGYSYGFTSGKHVCNDDTLYQYSYLAYGSNMTSTCGDNTLRRKAPTAY